MRDGAAADAAVDGGGGRGGEFAGEGADGVGVHVAGLGDGLGREVPYGRRHFVDALHDAAPSSPRSTRCLLEQDVGHRGEQQGVGAGADRDVPVGELGGAGAARVDDGERAAARLERLELAGEVGRGAQTPVGLEGVGADEQQMVGAVEVGYGDRVGVAVEQSAGDVLGHLVDRGGGEDVAGAEAGDQHRRVERAGHGVHVRVAEDDADGVAARTARPRRRMPAATASKASAQLASRSSPSRRTRGVRSRSGSLSRRSEGGALGADEPLAEHVVAVTAGAGDPAALDGERESAGGLAQGADTQGGAGLGTGVGGAGHGSSRVGGGNGDARCSRAYRPVRMEGRRCAGSRRNSAEPFRREPVPGRVSRAPAPDTPAAAPASPR